MSPLVTILALVITYVVIAAGVSAWFVFFDMGDYDSNDR